VRSVSAGGGAYGTVRACISSGAMRWAVAGQRPAIAATTARHDLFTQVTCLRRQHNTRRPALARPAPPPKKLGTVQAMSRGATTASMKMPFCRVFRINSLRAFTRETHFLSAFQNASVPFSKAACCSCEIGHAASTSSDPCTFVRATSVDCAHLPRRTAHFLTKPGGRKTVAHGASRGSEASQAQPRNGA